MGDISIYLIGKPRVWMRGLISDNRKEKRSKDRARRSGRGGERGKGEQEGAASEGRGSTGRKCPHGRIQGCVANVFNGTVDHCKEPEEPERPSQARGLLDCFLCTTTYFTAVTMNECSHPFKNVSQIM